MFFLDGGVFQSFAVAEMVLLRADADQVNDGAASRSPSPLW
jgi:hypothetical protein